MKFKAKLYGAVTLNPFSKVITLDLTEYGVFGFNPTSATVILGTYIVENSFPLASITVTLK